MVALNNDFALKLFVISRQVERVILDVGHITHLRNSGAQDALKAFYADELRAALLQQVLDGLNQIVRERGWQERVRQTTQGVRLSSRLPWFIRWMPFQIVSSRTGITWYFNKDILFLARAFNKFSKLMDSSYSSPSEFTDLRMDFTSAYNMVESHCGDRERVKLLNGVEGVHRIPRTKEYAHIPSYSIGGVRSCKVVFYAPILKGTSLFSSETPR